MFFAGFALFMFIFITISIFDTDEQITVASDTLLEIKFNNEFTERSSFSRQRNITSFIPKLRREIGLDDAISSIDAASKDENILALYLNLNNFRGGAYPKMEAVRRALLKFKDSGKPIFAYGNSISQKAYYIASIADNIYMAENGNLDFRGLAIEMMFLKGTLEKLDIDAQVFQAGKYKSAIEPFNRDQMTAENREQLSEYLNSVFNSMLEDLSEIEKFNETDFESIADNYLIRNSDDALNYRLVDSLVNERGFFEIVKEKLNRRSDEYLNKVKLRDYINIQESDLPYSRDRIAVIYALGEIHEGIGDNESIGTENIINALVTARRNSSVKAIVIRLNSPGGSALTSDLIWKEIVKTKEEKPVIVSMSDIAASGGYYISCAADTIIAEETTLTGSIGVWGMIPNMKEFYKENLGITFDRVKTSKYADMMTTAKPFSREEKKILQNEVDRIYDVFLGRVAESRVMSIEEVNKLGQGRIWTGVQAAENGLVDEIGGLNRALEIAAEMAGIEKYRLYEYPKLKEPFEKVMDLLYEDAVSVFSERTEFYGMEIVDKLRKLQSLDGIQARLPFEIIE